LAHPDGRTPIATDREPYATVLETDKREPAPILAGKRRAGAHAGGTFTPAMRIRLILLAGALLTSAGCGGSRQDADEPSGTFRVEIAAASFPVQQTIAQASKLRIDVRNADTRALPDVAVTVETKPVRAGAAPVAFGTGTGDTRLADPTKPVWILDRGPKGGTSAYTNTWSLGRMAPGETKRFEWRLTAVRAGSYTVSYRVSPGLDGKARAAGRKRVDGSFRVVIRDTPVPAHVDDNGNVVRGEPAGSGL
jgi:hypothetical protein